MSRQKSRLRESVLTDKAGGTMEIRTNLNKYFEIIGLLYSSRHPESMQEEMWEKAAAEYGINVEELCKKVGTVHGKYISAFQKAMIKQNDEIFEFFFSDDDDDFIMSVQMVCASHAEWFEGGLTDIEEGDITECFVKELLEEEECEVHTPPSFEEIINLLKAAGFSSNTCWKLMLFFQSPKKMIEGLSDIVIHNIHAYEAAVGSVKRQIDRLLDEFPKGKYLSAPLQQGTDLTPIMIYPAAELVNLNKVNPHSFVGLFTSEVYKLMENSKSTRKNLLTVLKALSDNSKFEILVSLMKSPKYSLELAEELNLSAATVSHHMSVLLTNRLVDVEKRDGRVYYTLSRETVKKIIDELNTTFLM